MEKQSFSAVTIEGNLSNSILYSFMNEFKKIIESDIKGIKEGDNFFVQNIDWLCYDDNGVPGLKDALLKKYNDRFNVKYSCLIPNSIKVNQAVLMDGLAFGVNVNTGDIKLYTLNVDTLFGLGVDADKVHTKCLERNMSGILHAYRIDIEYVSENEFQYKAVSLNKNNYLYASDYVLFSYAYIKGAMDLLSRWLEMGIVLKVEQEVGGILKKRYVTQLTKLLKDYCDNEEAVDGIKSSYYPLKGYMYVPVIGAPSTTAMVTKVDLFSLNRVMPVRSKKEIDIEKVKDPVKDTVIKTVIVKRLTEIEKTDSWGYMDIMYNLPRSEELFKDYESRGLVNTRLLSKYVNSLKDNEIEELCNMIPGTNEEVSRMSEVFSKSELVDMTKVSQATLRSMLRNGIYSVISVNKDCSYSSYIVTNNRNVLSRVYGKNYFAELEGDNVKIAELRLRVAKGENIPDALEYCGFPKDDAELIKAAEAFREDSGEGGINENISSQMLRTVAVNSLGGQDRKESSTGSILCRRLFGIRKEDGSVEDYYRYVSLPKIVRMIKLG